MDTYRDILVHVDHRAESRPRIAAAVELAQAFNAHLLGAAVYPQVGHLARATVVPSTVMELLRTDRRVLGEAAQDSFRTALEGTDVSFEWRYIEEEPIQALTVHGRYADLIVLPDTYDLEPVLTVDSFAGAIALGCGRPVLVLPLVMSQALIGARALVAWNGSREAARAANDALPLLKRAESVEVVSVNPRSKDVGEQPVPDIALHLSRHGVRVETRTLGTDDREPGRILMEHAASTGAGLLVLGAFGRARLRELIFGGVTDYVLRHVACPVLVSH